MFLFCNSFLKNSKNWVSKLEKSASLKIDQIATMFTFSKNKNQTTKNCCKKNNN